MEGQCMYPECVTYGTIRLGLCDRHYQQERSAGWPNGKPSRAAVTDQTREKISAALTGREGPKGEDHPMFGRQHSEDARAKMSAAKAGIKRGPQPNKYSENPGYMAIHNWIRRHYPRTGACEACGQERLTHWSNISGEYRRDRGDFWELCVPCHMMFDGNARTDNAPPEVVAILRARRGT